MSEHLQPADIFLTRGSACVSRAIRIFTRRIGEPRTKANHTGIVVEGGPLDQAVVVEALSTVKRHRLMGRYESKKGTEVAIYRPLNLSHEEQKTIVETAESYVGRTYGYFQLVGHFLDWFLQGAYVFRRLTRSDKYPICSWVVAQSFARVNKFFRVDPGAASPDDIHDFVIQNPDRYREIRKFTSQHRA